MKIVGTFITLFIVISISGQDMADGFGMLERGDFADAESFFAHVLTDFPENKTARLCYGRAVGLSGNPDKAIGLFEGLLNDYMGDMEVRLNLAESYLWKKQPSLAIAVYKGILTEDSTIFGAQLGIANSYSMSTQYAMAYKHVNDALAIQPGNPQAALSGKFIRLGYANKLAAELHQYDRAYDLLDENMKNDPEDQESLGLRANIYLIAKAFKEAEETYGKMKNPVKSLMGEAVALHLQESNIAALDKAGEALTLTQEEAYHSHQDEATMTYISALLWNNKLKEAEAFTDSVQQANDSPEFIASQAEVAMYQADFVLGVDKYTQYLEFEPKSFKGNLGKADALHALGVDTQSYDLAYKTQSLFPGQLDVAGFIDRLDKQHAPRLSATYTYGLSSDGSSFLGWLAEGSLSIGPLFSANASYMEKTFSPAGEGAQSASNTYRLGLGYQLSKRVKLNGSYGFIEIANGDSARMDLRSDIDASADIWVSRFQKTTIGYQTEIQDFNAALINQNLKTEHVVVKNNVFWKTKDLGWYTEAYYSFFSDGNRRTLIFTSLYKNLIKKPAIKSGMNYLLITFKESKPTNYYSPLLFNKIEAFIGLQHGDAKEAIAISWDLAGGIQIVDGSSQPNWRTQLVLSRSIGPLDFNITGGYSTISETQIAGFSYTEIKGQIIWRLTNKPIFHNRIRKTNSRNEKK